MIIQRILGLEGGYIHNFRAFRKPSPVRDYIQQTTNGDHDLSFIRRKFRLPYEQGIQAIPYLGNGNK